MTKKFMKENKLTKDDMYQYYVNRTRKIMHEVFPNSKAGFWNRGEKGRKYEDGDILQVWGYGMGHSLRENPKNLLIWSDPSSLYLDCGFSNQYSGGSW